MHKSHHICIGEEHGKSHGSTRKTGRSALTDANFYVLDAAGRGLEAVCKTKKTFTKKFTIVLINGYFVQNDNTMHDGRMTIHVNSYLGRLKETVIGRVYVDDADDWDLGDKTFSWKESRPGFELSDKGDITMAAEMAAGTYTMSANVHDNARDEDAVGYVTVIVNAVPQIAFDNQGSVQLLIAEETPLQLPDDFIRADSNGQSLMDTFKQEMAAYMGGDVTVDVFSVQVILISETAKKFCSKYPSGGLGESARQSGKLFSSPLVFVSLSQALLKV